MRGAFLLHVFADFIIAAAAQRKQIDDIWNHYETEPTFRSHKIRVVDSADDASLLAPGYLFLAPFPEAGVRFKYGPSIIEQNGELIWYGNASATDRIQNFYVCDFKGERMNHLCWSASRQKAAISDVEGQNWVLDNSYNLVGPAWGSAFPLTYPNPHEFNMLPGGQSFLQSVYQLTYHNLTPYAGSKEGYVLDGCFQEIDVHTGWSIFSWCGMDNLDLWETYVFLAVPGNKANASNEKYGDGTVRWPWDYFHLNSVDKTPEGDYFVSARHLDSIIKIAGNNNVHGVEPGTILWRLGGKKNQFDGADRVDLSRQHHVRITSTTATETTITLFNNQWMNAAGGDGRHISNGEIVIVNNETRHVTSVRKFHDPEGLLSLAQGSMQLLPNGNSFIGWGTTPLVTEFSPDGKILYHAHLAEFHGDKISDNQQNYRSYKFEWVGNPEWDPTLLAYSQNCTASIDSPLTAYVSWNGATKVRHWRFYTSHASRFGPWFPAGTFDKTGFETKAHLTNAFGNKPAAFAEWVSVEALDAKYNILASTIAATFVPAEGMADKCDADGCFEPMWFGYNETLSRGSTCRVGSKSRTPYFLLAFALVLVIVFVESLSHVMRTIWFSLWSRRERDTKGLIDEKSWP